jgi:hypothetical protein
MSLVTAVVSFGLAIGKPGCCWQELHFLAFGHDSVGRGCVQERSRREAVELAAVQW